MIQSCWAQNGEVRLHYLDNQGSGLPVVLVPGLHGRAEDFEPVLESLLPRRALAVSLRGRGQSSVPETGYRFEDHVADLHAILEAFPPICLIGHSVGATYALGYALEYPQKVTALVIGGYPARYPNLTADWALRTMMQHPDELPMFAVLGLQHDSAEISLWESLQDVACPLLVLRGGRSTSRLPQEVADEYRRWAPSVRIEVFEESGHRLWVPDMTLFVNTIEDFLTAEGQPRP
jgi:pimeloyl-ACP methyl ester carboxylesterase